ncbi:MAG TPA: hypothetical protein VFX51_20555 [Solirubrobacteraceae bacterium]|nr:hypothetical protein [Solirubrobacteraceae bacterium]
MLLTGSVQIDAERAFDRAARGRRLASLIGRLRGQSRPALPVYHPAARRVETRRGIRAIPLDAIRGTVEPTRAADFDADFRPARHARHRWQRVWMAEQYGTGLPPISVVAVGDAYALRDGHHRVSVARARGAVAIDAQLDDTLLI